VVAELGLLGAAWLVLLAAVGLRRRHPDDAGDEPGPARWDPALAPILAAFLPFFLLHYPAHVWAALVPIALAAAQLLRPVRTVELRIESRRIAGGLALALILAGIACALWSARRIEHNLWTGQAQMQIQVLLRILPGSIDPGRAKAALEEIEQQALERLKRMPGDAGTLWQLIGSARLVRHDYEGAEQAYRASFAAWPKEDAEFGIGLALNGQGRRNRALYHLGRVCRTNPWLLRQIPDLDLRRAVRQLISKRTAPATS
jgi:tetratricopeptide (TPR) repeat protein